MKLNKTKKHKWLRALRSGKFIQGQGALKATHEKFDENGVYEGKEIKHCCLGVACSIGLTRQHADGDEYCSPKFLPMKTQEKLANMNDTGVSFAKIASWISKNL